MIALRAVYLKLYFKLDSFYDLVFKLIFRIHFVPIDPKLLSNFLNSF